MKKSLFAAIAALAATSALAVSPHVDENTRTEWKNKSFTRAEALEKAGETFDRMDTNKDGVVTPQERKDAYEKFREHRKDSSNKEHHRDFKLDNSTDESSRAPASSANEHKKGEASRSSAVNNKRDEKTAQ